MLELNKVLIVGRLTRDPESRSIPSGSTVTSFGIACNRRRGKDKEDDATFVECEAWDKTGDFVSQWFAKGKGIYIEGRLKTDRWTDKTTGKEMSKLKVVVEKAGFDGSPKTDEADESTAATSRRVQANKAGASKSSRFDGQNQAQGGQEPAGDDDLPF